MDKILISACLLGRPVRYNGTARPITNVTLARWQQDGRLVPLCPEVSAGLPTPRPPAEIAQGSRAEDILREKRGLVEVSGRDVADIYCNGALQALELAHSEGCKFAILTDGSPSCGSSFIYDGTFSSQKIAGMGVVTALLRQNGIQVFSENQIDIVAELIER